MRIETAPPEPFKMTLNEVAYYEWTRYVMQIMIGEPYGWSLATKEFIKRLPKLRTELRKMSPEWQLNHFKNQWKDWHKTHVQCAIEDGETIAPQIISEYPELQIN